MKRSIVVCFVLLLSSTLFGQGEGTPASRASGKLYVGSDSHFSLQRDYISGRLGIVAQYFLNENLAIGVSTGIGGYRQNLGIGNPDDPATSRERRINLNPNATFYPGICTDPCYQPFVRVGLGFGRGRSKVEGTSRPSETPFGSLSFGIEPGLSVQLKNEGILNLSASILSWSRRKVVGSSNGNGNFFSNVNSGVGVELIFPIGV